jgi:hypothetical protein
VKKFLQNMHILIPLALGIAAALKVVSLGDINRLGSDAIIHTYKIELLIEQMKQQPVLFWGSWDWNWFSGYPFLRVYSPLYYFLVALVSRVADVSVTFSMELLYIIVYPLSAVAAYFLSCELTKDKTLSIIGVSVYFSCPAIVMEITSNGSIPRLPLYLLMPLSLFFMERLTEDNGRNVKFFVAAVLTFSALIFTHFWYALILTPCMALIMITKWIFVKRFDAKAFLLIPLSILISSASTFPLVYYTSTEGEVWPASAPAIPFLKPIEILYFFTGKGIGLIAFLTMIFSFVFLWKSTFHHGKVGLSTWKNNRYVPYIISAAAALCFYFLIYVLHKFSPALNIISGKYAIFAMFFISPVLACYLTTELRKIVVSKASFSSSKRKKWTGAFFMSRIFWASAMISITLITVVLSYHWFQPSASRWSEAYRVISGSIQTSNNSSAQGWFRVESIPRHPSQIAMQMRLRIPMVTGWFGLAGARSNKDFLRLAYWDLGHQDRELEKKLFHDPNYDPDPTIRAWRIFNVKYLLLDEEDPVSSTFLRETTSRLINSLNKSSLVELSYKNGSIAVFKIKDAYPLMASTNAFVIAKENVNSFYEIVSNESFTPSLGVFLSKDNDLEGLSVEWWDGNFENDGYVNVTIHEIEAKSMSVEFCLTADRDCFVSMPISYSSFLNIEIDDREVKMLKALPTFVSVQLPAGTHRITVSRVVTPLEIGSLAVSITALTCLIALPPIFHLRRRY